MKKRLKVLKLKTLSSENDSLERESSRIKRTCRGWLAQARCSGRPREKKFTQVRMLQRGVDYY